jgi:hypothetical protein
MAVRRLVDSWLSRSVAGLPSSSDDDPEPRWATGRDEGPAPRRRNGPGDDPGPEPGVSSDDGPEPDVALDEVRGTEPRVAPGDHLGLDPAFVLNGDPWSVPGVALDDDPGLDRGTGLDVPPAPAEVVIATARRVATSGLWIGPRPDPAPGLRSVAEAMVLDEHPSAPEWTLAERRDALDWIALIIDRFGEDGVQRLVTELNEQHPHADKDPGGMGLAH